VTKGVTENAGLSHALGNQDARSCRASVSGVLLQVNDSDLVLFDVAEAFEEAVRLTRMEERVVDKPESSESGSQH